MTDTTEDEPGGTIRPFSNWLREVQLGRTHDELSEKLHELIDRVTETGKKGTLSLAITIKPMKGNTKVLMVDDTIKVGLPAYDRETTLFFTDREGNLTRKDPNQLELPTVAAVPAPGDPVDLKKKQENA